MIGPFKRRRDLALTTLGLGLALIAWGLISIWMDEQRAQTPNVSGPVFENWSSVSDRADRIEIMSRASMFALERQDAGWVMPSRANYQVEPTQIAALDDLIGQMQLERAMTRDPRKLDRLGLGDPSDGGTGLRVRVLDSANDELVAFVLGDAQRDGSGVYLRRADEARAYAVTGEHRDLTDLSRWLGLDFWSLDASAIARAEIRSEDGQDWIVDRASLAQRSFSLVAPQDWRLITSGAANGVASAGAQLRFRDVRPRESLSGAIVAQHVATTFSGLVYQFDFVAENEERWVVITARALNSDADARAEHLNGITRGWAYLVSDDAYERLTRALNQVAEPTTQ